MKCDACGEKIYIDWEYYHNPNQDTNYHLDCVPNTNEHSINDLEKRFHED